MKPACKSFVIVVLAWFAAGTGWSQVRLPAVVTERGPHHRTWQRTSIETLPDGKTRSQVSSVVELATGMHYWKDGEWAESREEIEIFKDGAIARQGQHQVIWAPNLNTAGGIDLLTADGKRFRSHVLGLAFMDAASGQSVLIAEPKDCIGEVAGNQVIYRDAFDGGFVADVRYTYTRVGFEQDVIFRESVPSPAEFGLNPATTRLEVWTEFLDPPAPTKGTTILKQEAERQKRQAMVEPDLTDETLDFGAMQMGVGVAFPVADAQGDLPGEQSTPVGKNWTVAEGRQFLIEKVDYRDILPHLDLLPKAAAVNAPRREQMQARLPLKPRNTLLASLRPPVVRAAGAPMEPMRMASALPKERGFVVDYSLTSSTNDFTFKAGTTYLVTGDVQLTGLTTIEGNTVVKYTNSGTTRIWIKGALQCKTDSYRPAIFTGTDDGSVGESLSSVSVPTNGSYFGTRTLEFTGNTNEIDLRHIHIRHATRCFTLSSTNVTISHAQFGKCSVVFYVTPGKLFLRNVLVHDVVNAFVANGTNYAEHATFHRIGSFNASIATRKVYLTNSLLISATNATYSGDFIGTNLNDSGVFQTVGAAEHYLSTNSPYRNVGTTNIHPDLAKDLKKRTTYPPVVMLGQYITTDTTLTPQAQRDTDTPDLGYLYDPLDFVFSGVILTNATLTATGGVAIGTAHSSWERGLGLFNGARFICEGAPDNLNRIVRYNTVQEQANTNWSGSSPSVSTTHESTTTPPLTRIRFTEWSRMGQQDYHYKSFAACEGTNDILHSQFHGSQILITRPKFNFTNCLFNRVGTEVNDDYGSYTLTPVFQNITFNGGTLTLIQQTGDTWKFRDNLFDNTTISQDGIIDHDYNAYTTNSYSTNTMHLTNSAAHDKVVTVTNIAFEKGPLGYFYLPTNLTSHSALFDNGSTWATNVGLYHFTTITNQTKEAATKVDFGFHYVAVNSSGQPIDTDNDGLPDYFEDKNGNGAKDTYETGWLSGSGDTDGDGVNDYLETLLGRNPLVAGTTNDFNGSLNLRIYTPLK